MKNPTFLFLPVLCLFLLPMTSCIQSEAPNTEADIESVTVPGDILVSEIIENDRITLLVKAQLDELTALPLEFTLTPGATCIPESGTACDFSNPSMPVLYTVTSEDGQWSKVYSVSCIPAEMPTRFNFEHFRIVQAEHAGQSFEYYEFYEVIDNPELGIQYTYPLWASGNTGYQILSAGRPAEEYPTVAVGGGVSRYCAKLETRSTGEIGATMQKYMAAGNLFIGSYSGSLDALKATHFGLPFNRIPKSFTGYYKYKAGDVYMESNVPNENITDNFEIYAIFYETNDQVKYLDGVTVQDTNYRIMQAYFPEHLKEQTDQWTAFSIDFETLPGKTVDLEKLAANKYNLAVVFSSSQGGAEFNGAIGSTLYVDEVEIHY
ncbi:MAG: PCMD domain-containing protein [Rikenellaceae bacterium]|nr:PCMD domain-containing protein [Rikenellaceae bacterium]